LSEPSRGSTAPPCISRRTGPSPRLRLARRRVARGHGAVLDCALRR
jgi:hypothetical protein